MLHGGAVSDRGGSSAASDSPPAHTARAWLASVAVSAVREAAETLDAVVASMSGGGERRTGQRSMCEAVASALEQDRHLVVAAGTGTGKSMAYLAPLVASGKKAVVATATKALQDQLVDKDLPQLATALGMPLKFAVLKGRSNYLCRKKLADLTAADGNEQRQLIAADSSTDGRRVSDDIEDLAVWADETVDGDRAGLDFEPSARAWEAVSVSARECPGAANCPSGRECFAEQARQRAAEVDVLVVNHHLYFLHVFADAEILGSHEAVVLDEAHTLEDIAAVAAGVFITEGRFRSAARAVRAALPSSTTADDVSQAGRTLTSVLDAYRDQLLVTVADDMIDAAVMCRGQLDAASSEIRDCKGDETRRKMALRLLDALASDLARASDPRIEDAVWVEGSTSNPNWRTAPVDVAPMLQERLWAHTPAVLTSATVPSNLHERLGLPGDRHDRVDVGSPFNYRSSGLLYCPKHMPPPKAPGWLPAVQAEIAAMASAAGGRTLALFTSYSAMTSAAAAVREATGLRIYLARVIVPPAS